MEASTEYPLSAKTLPRSTSFGRRARLLASGGDITWLGVRQLLGGLTGSASMAIGQYAGYRGGQHGRYHAAVAVADPEIRGAEPTPAVHPPATPPAPRPPFAPQRFAKERLIWLLSVVIALAAIGCVAVILPGGWVLLGTLVLGVSIMQRQSAQTSDAQASDAQASDAQAAGAIRRQQLTMLLCLTTAATAVDYLTWRLEVSNWANWVIAGPLLAAEFFGALHVLGLQYTVWPKPAPRIAPTEDPARRPIFIFIPTVNEGPGVLRPTIAAALEAQRRYLAAYPHGQVTIVVCNDGRVANAATWGEVEELARRMGVVCVTRTAGGGAKAGNIEQARQLVGATGDALVAIFDADQLAKPAFLLKTIPPFADPTIGWVQSGQYYANVEQPVARWAHDQQALFYRILCPGKAAHNAAFICGTNVVIRAAALDQIGGLPQDSVTEDFAASIALHPTWRSIFLTEVLAVGLGPMDLPAYLRQQRRWAIGTLSVLRTHWRAILLPRRHGLRLEQRVQYFLACTHYLCGLRDLIYIIAPLAFLVSGVPAVRGASLALFLWHFLPYFLAAQAAFWYISWRQTGLRGIIIGFGSFPTLVRALLIVVGGRRSGFMVTAKQRRATRAWSPLAIYLLALFCCFAGIAVGLISNHSRRESIAISILWVLYDIVMLASFLWLGFSDLRYQESGQESPQGAPAAKGWLGLAAVVGLRARHARRLPAPGRVRARGVPVLAWSAPLMCACLVMISSSGALAQRMVAFHLGPVRVQAPYLGLTLRYESLETTPLVFERQLCLPLAIVGRTQYASEAFDFAWAEQLAANGQRPWITLQFGDFGANGAPPLSASLPAIANGLQDANIQRWAQAIHTYGRPIYLTILLHVDRNWSVSSAVANGGIPQDVPRAWEHVRALFAAAGDTNVAWVWAPADPAHDEAYAPPDATIDAVLQSMIRYPDTPWPDPAAVLRAEIARHPTKPVLLEVSADGPPAEKAAWLEEMVTAVQAQPQAYALLYHEGSPDVRATPAENTQWSLESDEHSFAALRAWQALEPSAALPCQSAPHSNVRPAGGPDSRESNQPNQPQQPRAAVVGQVAWRGRPTGSGSL
jgi:cellulose synthase (UDP-forming)